MRRRLLGLLVLLAVGALAVFGVWWMERHDAAVADEEDAQAKIIGFKPSGVRDVELDNANGHFVLTRDGSGWKLTSPMMVSADASVVDALVAAVADVTKTRNVEVDGRPPVATEVAMFGLLPPKAWVMLAADEGTKVLEIGKRNDFNGEVYARVRGADFVWMVGGGIEFQVNKSLFDLRDKRLLVFEPSEVERIDVVQNDRRLYAIVRENGKHRLLLDGGRSAEADALQVSGITTALSTLRATKFVDEAPNEAARRAAGFAMPDVLRVRLTLTGGRATTLALAHDADDHWHAMREGEAAPLAEISGDWLARKLDVDPKTLRDLRVVDFRRDDVAGITVTRGDYNVILKAGEGGTWTVTGATPAIEGLPREADASRCSGLVYRLFGLRAESVLTESATDAEMQAMGLAAAQLKVTLTGSDGNPLATLLVATDAQGRSIAAQVGRGRIDLIGPSETSDISAKVADYLPGDTQAAK